MFKAIATSFAGLALAQKVWLVAGGGRAVLWLDPGMKDLDAASELLRPYDARLMRCYSVSTRINHVANDDEECCRPVEVADVQHRLFA